MQTFTKFILTFFLFFHLALGHSNSVYSSNPSVLDINGQWIQGGLLFGQTIPGNVVFVLEQNVYVDKSGRFIFGLGRDVNKIITVKVTEPNNKTHTFQFNVSQREYDIQRITGIASKYVAPDKSVLNRIAGDALKVKQARNLQRNTQEFRTGFVWPLIGKITGVYGSQRVFNDVPSRPHYGLDIAAKTGTNVTSPSAGVVSLAHNNLYYSGGTLIIDHGQGLSSTFIHLSKIHVKLGDIIKQGQLIADVGSTGRSTGPHLDWRMNWKNQRIDPFLLLAQPLK